jgi:hypothetical protein
MPLSEEARRLLRGLMQPHTTATLVLGRSGGVVLRHSLMGRVDQLGWFEREVVTPLVAAGMLRREVVSGGATQYFITDVGKAAVEEHAAQE